MMVKSVFKYFLLKHQRAIKPQEHVTIATESSPRMHARTLTQTQRYKEVTARSRWEPLYSARICIPSACSYRVLGPSFRHNGLCIHDGCIGSSVHAQGAFKPPLTYDRDKWLFKYIEDLHKRRAVLKHCIQKCIAGSVPSYFDTRTENYGSVPTICKFETNLTFMWPASWYISHNKTI